MTGLSLSAQVFAILSALIEERLGIYYGLEERELLAEKVAPRVLERGLDSLLDYYYFLRYDPAADVEFARLAEVLVVNETYFFRELAPLEVLVQTLVPELLRSGVRPRIWCAACSTGEEPFTLAMLLDAAGLLGEVTIVASDLSARVLAHAREGVYFRRALRALRPDAVGRWLEPCEDGMRVAPHIAAAVSFQRVNLLDPGAFSALEPFDIVLCRNVLIYFSDATTQKVLSTLAERLRPGGLLLVGVSESLLRFDSEFDCEEHAGSFFYRKASR